jgi:hypothetical protein
VAVLDEQVVGCVFDHFSLFAGPTPMLIATRYFPLTFSGIQNWSLGERKIVPTAGLFAFAITVL